MDFSSKCYLFCECNSVRISQNIQNEVSLERSIFANVVAYQFINFSWRLNGSREECIIVPYGVVYDPSRPKRIQTWLRKNHHFSPETTPYILEIRPYSSCYFIKSFLKLAPEIIRSLYVRLKKFVQIAVRKQTERKRVFQESPRVRKFGFRNPENFWWWN